MVWAPDRFVRTGLRHCAFCRVWRELAICDDVSTQATLIDGSEVLTGATRPVQDPATAEAIAHAPEATAAVSEP
jgi:hypothetical protein